MHGLRYLKEALKANPDISVAEHKDLGGTKMEIEDVFGRSLADPKLEKFSEFERLRNIFRSSLPTVARHLEKATEYGPAAVQLSTESMNVRTFVSGSVNVWYRPSSIIVDAQTLHMYVVDAE